MVHKKSEYRLQFHVLPNDLRKQIWQENLRFRELRRAVNQADHFWSYQLVETSDSDDEDTDQSKEVTTLVGVKKGLSALTCDTENLQEVPIIKQNNGKSVAEGNKCKLKDTGVQTVELQDIVLLNKEFKDKKFSTVASNTEETKVKYERSQKKSSSSFLPPEFTKPTKAVKESDDPETTKHMRPVSASLQRSYDKIRSASPCRRSRSPSPRFSVLSRTRRKSYMEQKQPVFTDFGWNDSNRNVGDKKTYNILAPEKEVHPLALQALRNRQNEIEECLAQESQVLNADQTPMNSTNTSSIWMTEYKDKYCSQSKIQIQPRRPVSSPAQRSVSWTVR
ncbi:uncharacterized protein LOC126259166 isoform X1 [Schistocerca nitens]|uniref:uncharacterized protein LOC126259166 isoform X1 n=1 Tax=Schistocerca nitens TaxID=7011 RepID=UPI002118F780|nr:uncharacterized protein LOC126259166 isoform X1 [Schistocerca nitens]XP_049811683.1 uncharacterized protein LOC126259166 isoform X1 [Schistocerca nitens]XP_049811684.1 uncharacterized protein LOC126259166 isoform X1 [Schistocerca nitens]XP_049811685.1 uncharacterized protein LOC126259166 isoform X1 [Schistocerca nitens]XP_049811686.1 uncharacterized protein LOC126259166 isoform X1 [Schistocerca nitens]